MIDRSEWRWLMACAAALVVLASAPYAIAYLTTPDDLFYTGFLSNPEDGHTYLAKMRQGWRGEWLSRLAFSPEPHQGAFLFTYYLFLGHLARWLRLPLNLLFHLARAANGFLLLVALYWAGAHFFADVGQRRAAFLIAAVGSGLGWLAMLAGMMPTDLWVPEGYVFYSMFVNPHFPLAIALMILVLMSSVLPWKAERSDAGHLALVAGGATLLGMLQPFCLLTVGGTLLAYTAVRWMQRRCLPRRQFFSGLVLGLAGLPWAANAYLVSTRNPAFATWSAQNQTPSPPPWDYALGYGVVLALAVPGIVRAMRRRRSGDLLLLSWVGVTAVLLYLPFSLQRRLVTGLIVPLGFLAALGWQALSWRRGRILAWTFAGLTHLVLILMSTMASLRPYGTLLAAPRDEKDAWQWLAGHVSQDALVVAAPESGLYIPAWAGQRVYYGHRFETPDADARRAQVVSFFSTGDPTVLFPAPDYLYYGPRERALSGDTWQPDDRWPVCYRGGTVTVYALRQGQLCPG